ncbi:MAG TPA: BMP family ABC transporter substrate-binding protein, partial [Humisphaera sp.]|nr:BMP family ABC transporter substrate-binding protein [Humisphaera sp.]
VAFAAALGCCAALPGCSKEDSAKPLMVGFLYVGTKDDYGYNQAHAQGAAAVSTMPGVKVLEAEKIAETKDCQQTMATMIEQSDATLVFATSFGYFNPHVKEIAPKYPKITFLHAGGILKDGDPSNIGTFFAYIDELEYLCGMAAGSVSKTGKLGYVAAKPITPVLRDINAFELGAKSVNPKCTLTVIFTGDWFLPNEEANAVTNLADQGIDVVTGHIDSPKVMIQTAEKRGIYCCGYHYNGSSLAPKGYLTGAEWNWGPMYKKFVEDFKAGKPMPHNYMGSLKDGAVKMSPYSSTIPADAVAKIDAVKAQMTAGTFHMFTGPLKDNKGAEVIPAGKSFGDQDDALWGMNYLVEGVVGSTGS